MSDYLSNLVDKLFGHVPVVEPRRTPRFAPTPYLDGGIARPGLAPLALGPAFDNPAAGFDEELPAEAEVETATSEAPVPLQTRRRASTVQQLPRQEEPDQPREPIEEEVALSFASTENAPRSPAPTPEGAVRRAPSAASQTVEPVSTPPASTAPVRTAPSDSAVLSAPARQSSQMALLEQAAPVEDHPSRTERASTAEATQRISFMHRGPAPEPAIAPLPPAERVHAPSYEFEQGVVLQTNAARLATVRIGTFQPVIPLTEESSSQEQSAPGQPAATPGPGGKKGALAEEIVHNAPEPGARHSAVKAVSPGAEAGPPPEAGAGPPQVLPSTPAPVWRVAPQIHVAPPVMADSPPPNSNTPPAPSTIQVTIGRVEVRATPPPPPPARKAGRAPVLSLDDYLRSRRGESR